MNPGFEVKAGSKFEAYIQGCTGAGSPPRPLKVESSGNGQYLKPKPNPEGN
jgi:hypothetical protein